MLHPITVAATPSRGPRKMQVTNMITGARLMDERGGGRGMARIVVTAIRAARMEVNATVFVFVGFMVESGIGFPQVSI
jgi:hypothetical protein